MDRNEILNDSETAMRYALQNLQSQMWTALPCIVQSVNLTAMAVTCTPAIKGVQTNSDGSQGYVTMPLLQDVPIVFPSAGGMSLTLPIAAGDEVLVVFASRCIDAWWQNGSFQQPLELRMHDLSDGFAIPGPRSQKRLVTGISSANARLVNDAGTCYLEVQPSGTINLVATGGVNITGNLVVSGTVEADGQLKAKGGAVVTGALTATGEITAKQGGTPIDLSVHIHSGVTTGAGVTGPPQG